MPSPISPRQQRHLAFLSDFNVQMLYLPGLINVVVDFLSPPPLHRSHLELLPLGQWQIQLTTKPWSLSKIVAWKCSVCLAVHLSKWRFDKQGPNAWLTMFQLVFFCPIVPAKFRKDIFCICTTSHILGGSPPGILFHLDSFCAGSSMTSPPGRDPACTAKRARSTATPPCCCSPSPSLKDSLLSFTSTWWALYSIVIIVITFSHH